MPEHPPRSARSGRRPSRTSEEAAALRTARAGAFGKAQAATLEAALGPLLARVGGEVVQGEPAPDDIPVQWLGELVFHVRLPPAEATGGNDPEQDRPGTDLSDGLSRLIASVEEELGRPLASLSRAEKQQAVRMLEDRGAFEMRRSAETVAEALGLTRFTVYNYLNRVRERGDAGSATPG